MPNKKDGSPVVTRRATRRGSASSRSTTSASAEQKDSPNGSTKADEASAFSYRSQGRKPGSRRSSTSGSPKATESDPPSQTTGKIVNAKKTLGEWASHKFKASEKTKVNEEPTEIVTPPEEETEKIVTESSPDHNGRLTRNKRKAQDQAEEIVVDTAVSDPVSSDELHIVKRGIQIRVKIILNDGPYSPSQDSTSTVASIKFLGNDGNQFYCQVCREFGDVVCCDGCPKVFHPNCLDRRQVLDCDQEPWFCPLCTNEVDNFENHQDSPKAPRTPSRCTDCQKLRHGFDLLPCSKCGDLVHSPSCLPSSKSTLLATKDPLCRKCRGDPEEAVTEESPKVDNPIKSSKLVKDPEQFVPVSSSKKKRPQSEPASEEKRKKKKKKRRHSNASFSNDGASATARSSEVSEESPEEEPLPRPVPSQSAFFFYIAENRLKVEKALTKGHRTFNRLPKGNERNALVAKEALQWWNGLADDEKRPYVVMAVKDFELKLLAWKEEMEAIEYHGPDETGGKLAGNGEVKRIAVNHLAIRQYDRLYQKTSVGSRLFKPEADQSHNRVLLDLLYDTRFHPLPLFDSSRNDTDLIQDQDAGMNKASVPFFDVHGPISTSIGDECMGCNRGWNHQCPVIKQRVPYVEYRARLQPPVSALTASRIGLGLRPKPAGVSTPDRRTAEMFRWKHSMVGHQLDGFKHSEGYTLSKPSERTDEIVRFIEEAAIMKAPEPIPPYGNESAVHSSDEEGNQQPSKHQKCGRCRAIILNDTGCVQCRRASLVIDKSKCPLAHGTEEIDRLKIQTTMLKRIQAKDDSTRLHRFDNKVSEAISHTRWSPSCVLPGQPVMASKGLVLDECTTLSESGSDLDVDEDLYENDVTQNDGPQSLQPIEASIVHQEMRDGNLLSPNDEVEAGDELIESGEEKSCQSDVVGIAVRSKRTRSTRVQSQSSEREATISPQDEMIANHKRDAKEVNKKAIQTACYCLFSALLRRDPLHLFARPVQTEDYLKYIKNPINFGLIRRNLLDGRYSTLGTFCSDCRLLCENALAFNSLSSIYYKTASEMHKLLANMQKRAEDWIGAIKCAYEAYIERLSTNIRDQDECDDLELDNEHPLMTLGAKWPEAIQLLERSSFYRSKVESDFMRTSENEIAYYGTLAVQRAALAAEISMAPYPESNGKFATVAFRDHRDDEALRQKIDDSVGKVKHPELRTVSTWREESLVRLVRKVQTARLDRKTVSENGCSRCDPFDKAKLQPNFAQPAKDKKKEIDHSRTHPTRKMLTTGLGSEKVTNKVAETLSGTQEEAVPSVISTSVAVHGSKTHGMGLYAEQTFKAGDIVGEYVGEYVAAHVADLREKLYRKQRIQDYQFRLNDQLVIDATKKGGPARYINHSCSPNCKAKIVDGSETKELRRVLIIAQKDININEEISYDYQFPLELDLSARIPCNCGSDSCRGFMNWDLPEKGSNCRVLLVQKRGANMRDRIRRLGRPLKRDE